MCPQHVCVACGEHWGTCEPPPPALPTASPDALASSNFLRVMLQALDQQSKAGLGGDMAIGYLRTAMREMLLRLLDKGVL